MNTFRHYLALVYLLTVPPAMLMWVIIHPFVELWRKIGPVWTYVIATIFVGSVAAGLFQAHEALLAVDYGTNWLFVALGGIGVTTGVRLRMLLHRHFSNQQLMGLPELAPDRLPQRLVTEGLHARVRHPRYLQFLLVVASLALIANHLALYVVAALLVPGIRLVVLLEERELRERFGPAYDEYSRRVPRFIPRWRGRK